MTIGSLAKRMQKIKPSATIALNSLAQSMQKSGIDIVNLTAGETDFYTNENVKEAAIRAIRANRTRYTASHGIAELRQRVARWFKERWGLSYSEKQVTVCAGVKQGIFNLAMATLGDGDEVIIPTPYWVSYPAITELAGAVPVYVKTDPAENFRIDPKSVERAITKRTKWIILNSPNNPTGAIASADDLAGIARILEGTDILVVSDEIYAELSYQDTFASFAALSPDAFNRTVTLNGLSKSHAMTGWRVGFAAGPEGLIEAMGTIQGQSVSNITSFVQDASIEALNLPTNNLIEMRRSLLERRDLAVKELKQEKRIVLGAPPGAFYCFPDLSAWFGKKSPSGMKITDSNSMAQYLLKDALVAVVPGEAFGEDRCIRLSFATNANSLKKGIERILSALQKLGA